MTTYRIWDESVLEKPADFTLNLELPEGTYLEANPDGSTPSASLKVEGTSLKFAFASLMQLHENEAIIEGVLLSVVGADFMKMLEDEPDKVTEAMEKQASPFLTFEFTATGEDGASNTMTLRAPSGITAIEVFDELTKSKRLNALATSFMPIDSDDDY